ncbi:MAG: Cohesin domain protein [Candidatus Accumulibacter regalis]|uniref:Cohesin domain protein n=1 Tax=Accumulibacter regalis TaxID=522306 RepID=A0A011QLT1_ACCRE|nr:MAG: Cohesin domain protein [Candidatus Accumulibacter regalis]
MNDAPVATDDAYTQDEDTPLSIPASGVLGNDSDIDSATLTAVLIDGPQHGTLELAADGGFLYTPDADYFGSDSFTYRANDGQADSNQALVMLTIQAVNDAPRLDPIANRTVEEGSLLSITVSAFDVESDALSFSLDSAPAGATIDAGSGLLTWTPADGPAGAQIIVRATDAAGAFTTAMLNVSIVNVAPTVLLSGPGSVGQAQIYTLNLSASDPGEDSISGWSIAWGDGSIEDVPGNQSTVTHSYAASGPTTVFAMATDEDGSYRSNTLQVEVNAAETFIVTSFVPTPTGFEVMFNRAVDSSVLNLYDAEAVYLGAPDLTLVGLASGFVTGSLVPDANGQRLTFIRSGGILLPDDYVLRLESGANAFKDLAGRTLDGNRDGLAGDAFEATFAGGGAGRALSLPDFMRGPGQSVDLTACSQGGFLPLYLSDGSGVTSVEFTLTYDPTALVVQGVSAGADLPANATIEDLSAANGVLKVRITSPITLAAGKVQLLNIAAWVPATAVYGVKEVLDLDAVIVDGAAAVGDDALHLVGYIGDASGNGAYSTLDGQQIQRVIVNLDSGFAAYPNVDPLIVADINGSGMLTSIDVSRLMQEVSYLNGATTVDRLEIPPIPTGIGPLSFSGPDPRVDIPINATAGQGELVSVPVRIDTAAGLESVQLRIGYDASRFDLIAVRRGTITGDFGWFISGNAPGWISVDMARLSALQDGSGSLLDIDLRTRVDAAPGVTAIDLQYALLNDGRLSLNVAPLLGTDETDGRITIVGAAAAAVLIAAPVAQTLSQTQLLQTQQPIFDLLGQQLAPVSNAGTPPSPIIDFSTRFSLPTTASRALAVDSKSKPWLNDYLGNVGQARKALPNAGLKITIPVSPEVSALRSAMRV